MNDRLAAMLWPAILACVLGIGAWFAVGYVAAAIAASMAGAALGAWICLPDGEAEFTPMAAPQPPVEKSERAPLAPGAGRALLDALPIGVILIGQDRLIRFVNPIAADLFGLRSVAGLSASALRARRLVDLVNDAFEADTTLTAEFPLARQGEMVLKAQAALVGEGADESVLVTIEDQTQANRANDLHRDFVANASHELKTPLAAVAGIIETLQGHAKDDPEAAERFLAIMAAQASRMNRLVEDLLSLNRIEVNERVQPSDTLDLALVIGEVIETLRPYADGIGVTISCEGPTRKSVVLADRNELFQLFQNLIDNAIKYGGSGSTVRLTSLLDPTRQPGMIGIAIQDEGPGIPREHLPRLTERFYRVSVSRSREKGGTGLGLAIVKHILNRHRGRLEIESKLGEGARFTVWLPVASDAPIAAPKRDEVAVG